MADSGIKYLESWINKQWPADQILFKFKIPAVHIVRTLNTATPPNLPVVRKWRSLAECI